MSVDGKKTDKLEIGTGDAAAALKTAIDAGTFTVSKVEKKPTKRNPYAPFTTSSLQQEASSRLGFSPSRTMQIAQRLYEDGIITYMRTDARADGARGASTRRAAPSKRSSATAYLPPTPRIYQTKAKNAQEAHEAIRPTDMFRNPDMLHLDADQQKLYGLIWRRTLASQMRPAEIERTTADIDVTAAGRAIALRAVGSVVTFPGLPGALWRRGQGRSRRRRRGQRANCRRSRSATRPNARRREIEQHFTQPPPRYSEASLIKKMEELGIGRPSTYAATITVLQDRDYVRLEKRALIPEDRGRHRHGVPRELLQQAMSSTALPPGSRNSSTGFRPASSHWKDVLREFWDEFHQADR